MLWQIILPASEEGLAKREEVLSLGIVPMAVQTLMHASSTVVAPAAGVVHTFLQMRKCQTFDLQYIVLLNVCAMGHRHPEGACRPFSKCSEYAAHVQT